MATKDSAFAKWAKEQEKKKKGEEGEKSASSSSSSSKDSAFAKWAKEQEKKKREEEAAAKAEAEKKDKTIRSVNPLARSYADSRRWQDMGTAGAAKEPDVSVFGKLTEKITPPESAPSGFEFLMSQFDPRTAVVPEEMKPYTETFEKKVPEVVADIKSQELYEIMQAQKEAKARVQRAKDEQAKIRSGSYGPATAFDTALPVVFSDELVAMQEKYDNHDPNANSKAALEYMKNNPNMTPEQINALANKTAYNEIMGEDGHREHKALKWEIERKKDIEIAAWYEAQAEDAKNVTSLDKITDIDNSSFKYMSETEARTLGYLWDSNRELAKEYMTVIDKKYAQMVLAESVEKTRAFAKKVPVLGFGSYIFTRPLADIGAAVDTVYRTVSNKDFDPASPLNANKAHTDALRQGGSDAIDNPVLQTAVDVGLEVINSTLHVPLKGFGMPLMAIEAAGASAYEASMRGAANEQAVAIGLSAGALEAATEALPFDELLRIFKYGGDEIIEKSLKEAMQKGLSKETRRLLAKNIVTSIGINGIEEFFGEGLSSVGNAIVDKIVMGDKSNFMIFVEEAMRDGKSEEEAYRLAIREVYVMPAVMEGLMGSLAGIGSASIGHAFNARSYSDIVKTADANAKAQGGVTEPAASGEVDTDTVAGTNEVMFSLSFGGESVIDKPIIRLVNDNMDKIPTSSVFDVTHTDEAEAFEKQSDYVMSVFNSQGNTAYNDQIGTVELGKSGAKSTLAHGYGETKLAAVEAIKPAIENGVIIDTQTNYNNKQHDRYTIAARGKVNGEDVIVAAVVKAYPGQNLNNKFYLHEVKVLSAQKNSSGETLSPTAPQLSEDTVDNVASANPIIPQTNGIVNGSDNAKIVGQTNPSLLAPQVNAEDTRGKSAPTDPIIPQNGEGVNTSDGDSSTAVLREYVREPEVAEIIREMDLEELGIGNEDDGGAVVVKSPLERSGDKSRMLYTAAEEMAQYRAYNDKTATEKSGHIAGATDKQIKTALSLSRLTGRRVIFNSTDIRINGSHQNGTVIVNPKAVDSEGNGVFGQVIMHELMHSVEDTKYYDGLISALKAYVGEDAWYERETEVYAEYEGIYKELTGEEFTDADATREVAARVMQELFENDADVEAFVKANRNAATRMWYRLCQMARRVGGGVKTAVRNIGYDRQTRIANGMEEADIERATLREIEKLRDKLAHALVKSRREARSQSRAARKGEGNGKRAFDIVVLDNGNTYVKASRNVIIGNDKKIWRRQITNFFNDLLEGGKSINIDTIEGDVLTITKAETANKARDESKEIKGQRVQMSDDEFRVKLHAEAHIDEIAETAIKNSAHIASDTKSHSFAKDGFSYRTAFFEDFDGEYYRLRLSIGHNGTVATIYNVGKIEKDAVPSATKIVAVVGSQPPDTSSSDNSISHAEQNVKPSAEKTSEYKRGSHRKGFDANNASPRDGETSSDNSISHAEQNIKPSAEKTSSDGGKSFTPPSFSLNTAYRTKAITELERANKAEAIKLYNQMKSEIAADGESKLTGEYIYEKTGWFYDKFDNLVVDPNADVYVEARANTPEGQAARRREQAKELEAKWKKKAEAQKKLVGNLFAPDDKATVKYERQIDRFITGSMPAGDVFKLGDTPTVLTALGADNLPMVMSQRVMDKIMNGKHVLSLQNVRDIPKAISDPVMVFESATVDNAFVVLTELRDTNGDDVIIALHMNRKQDRVEVNRIASAYGKGNITNFVEAQINEGNLRYIENRKSQQWSTSRGLQLPKLVQSITDNNSISQNYDSVNRYSRSTNKSRTWSQSRGLQLPKLADTTYGSDNVILEKADIVKRYITGNGTSFSLNVETSDMDKEKNEHQIKRLKSEAKRWRERSDRKDAILQKATAILNSAIKHERSHNSNLTPSLTSVRKCVDRVGEIFGGKYTMTELTQYANRLLTLYDRLDTSDTTRSAEFIEGVSGLVIDMQFTTIKDVPKVKMAKKLKSELRKGAFVPQEARRQWDDTFGKVRRDYYERFPMKVKGKATDITKRYAELSAAYPDMFPEDITGIRAQVERICAVADEIYDTNYASVPRNAVSQADMEKAIRTIAEGFNELVMEERTFAGRILSRIDNMKDNEKIAEDGDYEAIFDEIEAAYIAELEKEVKDKAIETYVTEMKVARAKRAHERGADISKEKIASSRRNGTFTDDMQKLYDIRFSMESEIINKKALIDEYSEDGRALTADEQKYKSQLKQDVSRLVEKKNNLDAYLNRVNQHVRQMEREVVIKLATPEELSRWKDKTGGMKYEINAMDSNVDDIAPKDSPLADFMYSLFGHVGKKGETHGYSGKIQEATANAARVCEDFRERVKTLDISQKVLKGDKLSESQFLQVYCEAKSNIYALENNIGGFAVVKKGKVRNGFTLDEWQICLESTKKDNPGIWKNGDGKARIEELGKSMQDIYDELFSKINKARIWNGYAPIPYHMGYYPHFINSQHQDGFMALALKEFGFRQEEVASQVPTSIIGLTNNFKPGMRYMSHAKERSLKAEYDINEIEGAVEGFNRYIPVAADVICKTEAIRQLRDLAYAIRNSTNDKNIKADMERINSDDKLTQDEKDGAIAEKFAANEKAMYALGNFVQHLEDYTNLYAGKQSKYRKLYKSEIGRYFDGMLNKIVGNTGKHMVLGKLGTPFTNFLSLTYGLADIKVEHFLGAMCDMSKAQKVDDGFVACSDFLTSRRGSDSLVKMMGERADGVASAFMNWTDEFTSELLMRARVRHNESKDGGRLSHAAAVSEADHFISKMMGDRSAGMMPTIFQHQTIIKKIITMFQVEPLAQVNFIRRDLLRDSKHLYTFVSKLLALAVLERLFNDILELILMRRPGGDTLENINVLQSRFTGKKLGTLADIVRGKLIVDMDTTSVSAALYEFAKSTGEQVPFIGGIVFGGGRVPVSNLWSGGESLVKGIEGLELKADWRYNAEKVYKGLSGFVYNVFVPYGGQVKNIVEGLDSAIKGGSFTYDKDGSPKLRYPIYQDEWGWSWANYARAVAFGATATEGGRDWIANGFGSLTAKQTEAYLDMVNVGEGERDAFEFIRSLSACEDQPEKYAALLDADLIPEAEEIVLTKIFDYKEESVAKYKELKATGMTGEEYLMLNASLDGTVSIARMEAREDMLEAGVSAAEVDTFFKGFGGNATDKFVYLLNSNLSDKAEEIVLEQLMAASDELTARFKRCKRVNVPGESYRAVNKAYYNPVGDKQAYVIKTIAKFAGLSNRQRTNLFLCYYKDTEENRAAVPWTWEE